MNEKDFYIAIGAGLVGLLIFCLLSLIGIVVLLLKNYHLISLGLPILF
ncbi:hypothetical protein MACH08_05400 [Oceanobacillus kimchii]|uniref:Uncharacterized protein n=1 Tax=Oceanobacillus kimchii TaxID=746691 RepID=A0ABQ5TF14_9BACI|nr:hypothetical protein MACH08_05400 [Oceanobacillus kimchii]